jgi:hypothetical protein
VVHAPLVGDRGRRLEPARPLPCPLHSPGVRGDDHHVVEAHLADRAAQDRHRAQVVDRDVEEALHLRGVQVQRHHPVGAGRLYRVRADPGPDRHPRLVLLVGLGVAEVRDDRGDRGGAGPLERVDPEQQLHEVVVHRVRRRLDHEHVAAADILQHPYEEVALLEAQHLGPAQRTPEIIRDLAAEARAAGPGEQQELLVHGDRA